MKERTSKETIESNPASPTSHAHKRTPSFQKHLDAGIKEKHLADDLP